VRPEQILAEPRQCADFDYTTIDSPDFSARLEWIAARAGTAHGHCLWFDAFLAEGVTFSNAPGAPELTYGSAFFPWNEPVPIEAGDRITLGLRADLVGDAYAWSWDVEVESSQGRSTTFTQSDFFAAPMSPSMLRRQAASHRPALNEEGEISRVILDLMEEGVSLGEIARRVAQAFPRRFRRWQDALTRVGELSARYCR
jgi:protein arginine N-methyltransferase 1